MFTQQNTEGFTQEELGEMSAELENLITADSDDQDVKYAQEKILRKRGAA